MEIIFLLHSPLLSAVAPVPAVAVALWAPAHPALFGQPRVPPPVAAGSPPAADVLAQARPPLLVPAVAPALRGVSREWVSPAGDDASLPAPATDVAKRGTSHQSDIYHILNMPLRWKISAIIIHIHLSTGSNHSWLDVGDTLKSCCLQQYTWLIVA